MKINALIMDEKDNVATCTMNIRAGEPLCYRKADKLYSLFVLDDIPCCHKAAIAAIKKGESVIKYGEVIGGATEDIPAGGWVSHENIMSLPRDYESELIDTEGNG